MAPQKWPVPEEITYAPSSASFQGRIERRFEVRASFESSLAPFSRHRNSPARVIVALDVKARTQDLLVDQMVAALSLDGRAIPTGHCTFEWVHCAVCDRRFGIHFLVGKTVNRNTQNG
jgi:hypothetical protein